LIEYGLTSH